jgi:sec-independent protein translocase protein TatC
MSTQKKKLPAKRRIPGKNLSDKGAYDRGDPPSSFTNHLGEFRSRLLTVLISIAVTTLIPFMLFGDKVLSFLSKPYTNAMGPQSLYLFDITEPFTTQLKASLTIGLFAVVPIIIHQLWGFIRPAIDNDKRAFIRNIIIMAVFLFYTGVGLTFFYGLPFVIKTLQTFVIPEMKVMQGAGSYLSFTFLFCTIMGLVFEMPLAIMILAKLGIISPEFLSKKRGVAVIAIWIGAAVITPTTDPLTLTLVAIPLMALYEISIILAKIIMRREMNNT